MQMKTVDSSLSPKSQPNMRVVVLRMCGDPHSARCSQHCLPCSHGGTPTVAHKHVNTYNLSCLCVPCDWRAAPPLSGSCGLPSTFPKTSHVSFSFSNPSLHFIHPTSSVCMTRKTAGVLITCTSCHVRAYSRWPTHGFIYLFTHQQIQIAGVFLDSSHSSSSFHNVGVCTMFHGARPMCVHDEILLSHHGRRNILPLLKDSTHRVRCTYSGSNTSKLLPILGRPCPCPVLFFLVLFLVLLATWIREDSPCASLRCSSFFLCPSCQACSSSLHVFRYSAASHPHIRYGLLTANLS